MQRRDCLKLGVAGLAGGSLANLLRLRAANAEENNSAHRCPFELHLEFGWMVDRPISRPSIRNRRPGRDPRRVSPHRDQCLRIRICEHLPKLAMIADKYAIVRLVCHNQGTMELGTIT